MGLAPSSSRGNSRPNGTRPLGPVGWDSLRPLAGGTRGPTARGRWGRWSAHHPGVEQKRANERQVLALVDFWPSVQSCVAVPAGCISRSTIQLQTSRRLLVCSYALRSSPYALRPTLFALRSSPFALRSKRVEPRLDLAARCLDGEAIVGSPWLTDLVQQLFGESLELICLVEQSIGVDEGLIGPLGSVANLHRQ